MGSQWALEQAKYNLVNEYMLVGVTEELEDFVMMLEAALPRFFKGATELYKTGAAPATQFKGKKKYIYIYIICCFNPLTAISGLNIVCLRAAVAH